MVPNSKLHQLNKFLIYNFYKTFCVSLARISFHATLCITFKNGFKEVHFLVRLSVALPLCASLFQLSPLSTFKRGKGLLTHDNCKDDKCCG